MDFSDYYKVSKQYLDEYGALDISLDQDLPLFIDPFLLYASDNIEYNLLHDEIIKYLVFLCDLSILDTDEVRLKYYYCFREIKQNWLGFTYDGNSGSGLNMDFARKLHKSLHGAFSNFGNGAHNTSPHLEKLVILEKGVGKDKISDFTTNLMIDYIARYTEEFAKRFIKPSLCKKHRISRAVFNYESKLWEPREYFLPTFNGDYVLLTPKDILARDNTWINRDDLCDRGLDFYMAAVDNAEQRLVLNEHLRQQISEYRKKPSKAMAKKIIPKLLSMNPFLLDLYIKEREESWESANKQSELMVAQLEEVKGFARAVRLDMDTRSDFANTYDEAHFFARVFKNYIENNDGYRVINRYDFEKPCNERTVQDYFGLALKTSKKSQVDREVNNGRGPVDYKLSRGKGDSTLIEMKLASNKKLKKNLQNQLDIYKVANDTGKGIVIIVYYTEKEFYRVKEILLDLGLVGNPDVYLIDARNDNKKSASAI